MSLPDLSPNDWLSLAWFVLCWFGYARYSGLRARPHRRPRLQDALQAHILHWIRMMQQRDNRIVDTAVISNIERNATFLASSCLLIIAGLVTALGASDKALNLLADMPFTARVTPHRWDVGILLLLVIYVYAFFTFTWCMRQWGFASFLVGGTPPVPDTTPPTAERERHIEALAQVVWLAIYHFNNGLRAYYFSIALLAWFVHPLLFMLASTWVVAVLYRREFHSRTLKALLHGLPDTP
ncbi:MAG TPA: DUF599 family protein [Thiolinea sp.]|nr:DUF599 family protein [Thiolinea sp.]